MATPQDDRDELADLDVTIRMPDLRPVVQALSSGPGLRAVAVVVGGIVLLALPRSPRLYAVVIAAVLVSWALGRVAETRTSGAVSRRARMLLPAAGAVVLVVWPSPSLTLIGQLIGTGLVGASGLGIVRVLRRGGDDRYVDLAGHALTLSLGVATLLVPEVLLDFTVSALGLAWVVAGGYRVVRVASSPRGRSPSDATLAHTARRWLLGRSQGARERTALFEMLFFEGDDLRPRLVRFLALMAFSTTIAAWGVAVDSTAVVIGAMLIAPLMTPLMATSLSVTMGWPRRSLASALVALTGVAVAVGLSAIIGLGIPYEVPLSNPQISSRVTPTLADLIIALAAGGAGAFALSRRDVSDALPGVAVAIALVPPLAVAGLMVEAGETAAAGGAMLLFTTNMVAILLAGSAVFVLTGVVPLQQLVTNRRWIRSTLALVAAVAVVVVVPLTVSGDRILAEAFDRRVAQEAVEAWLEGDASEIREVSVQPDTVFVRLAGPTPPPDASALADDLQERLQRPLTVEVRWTQELTFEAGGEEP